MAGTAVGTINLFNYFGRDFRGVLIGGILTVTGVGPSFSQVLRGSWSSERSWFYNKGISHRGEDQT